MAVDRSIRLLTGLGGASSSRVLNLCSIALAQADNPGHRTAPFFQSPVLNSSIVLKHSIRGNEQDMFTDNRALATKVIVPFNTRELLIGGRSVFVGQKNFRQIIADVGNYKEDSDLQRDLDVLQMVDSLPSLDPFLVREQLDRNGIKPDACYFTLSSADQQRMAEYSISEVQKLTFMATGGKGSPRDPSTQKIVKALLSNGVNEMLEPFRITLQLDPSQFADGIYSWRGFLYYKWGLQEIWPRLIDVMRSVRSIEPKGKVNSEEKGFLKKIKGGLLAGVKDSNDTVRRIIDVYDGAYSDLIDHKDPKQFREFLLSAPALFLDLGEKMGAMSHMVSFWHYRFPATIPKGVDAEELILIFQDFAQSLGLEMAVAA